MDPQQPILVVTPLKSVPYTGPPQPYTHIPSPTEGDPSLPTRNQPAMVFIPPHSAEKEWDDLVAATKSGVTVTGSAAMGMVGPALGLIDIGESEDTYVFRVSLPGVANDEKFSCNVEPKGRILIKGVTSTGEKKVHRNNMVFEMQTQNLCPPGGFSVSFQLPGPIDHQEVTSNFGLDGIFEGVVKKKLQKSL
ncbi:unnamed protein product [Ilex paraguariensis]|uniref:SHSP domain-containing protein n=1 Tax=Ilex paraguariensis TaxID=185542 RepID=A0ABC8SWB5_9AQUA